MFTISIDIQRSAAAVFERLTDLEAAPSWYSAVTKVSPLGGGDVASGSRFQFERQIAGRTMANEVEVTELQEDRLLVLASRTGPTPFVYRYRLAPHGESTTLTLEGEISGEGLPGLLALAAPLASAIFQRGMRSNLLALRQQLERPA